MAKTNYTEIMRKFCTNYGDFNSEIIIGCGDTKDSFTIRVRSGLNMSDYGNMIIDIAQACFATDKDHGKVFAPYLVDFAKMLCAIKYYTDIKIPNNQDVLWRFVRQYDLEKEIDAKSHGELFRVYAAADQMIECMRAESENIVSRLIDAANQLVDKIASIGDEKQELDDFTGVKSDLKEMLDTVNTYIQGNKFGLVDHIVAGEHNANI